MTSEEFIAEATGYYGRYNKLQAEYVEIWLKNRTEKQIAAIWSQILVSFSAQYGKPPTVKELEDAWKYIKNNLWDVLYPPPSALPEPVEDPVPYEVAVEFLENIMKKLKGGNRKTRPDMP